MIVVFPDQTHLLYLALVQNAVCGVEADTAACDPKTTLMNTSVGQMDQNDVWLAEAVEYQSSVKPPFNMNSSELRLSNNDLQVETDTDKCLAMNTFTDRVHDRIVLPPSPTIAVQTALYSEVAGTNSGLGTNGEEIGQFSNRALNATGGAPSIDG